MDTQIVLRGFINKQISSSTKRNYELVIKRFLNWTDGQIKEGNLWVTEYQNYLKSLTDKAGKPLENRTVNYHVVIVGKFYKEATGKRLEYDRLKEKPIDVQFLTNVELKKVLDNSEGVWKAVVAFFADSGLRVSELTQISKQKFVGGIPME
jgi:integrase